MPQTAQQAKQPAVLPSRAVADAVAGAVSGAVARFVIGPLDVLKIRFQVQLEPIQIAGVQAVPSKYTGILQACKLILKEEGIQVSSTATNCDPLLYYKASHARLSSLIAPAVFQQ